MYWHTTEDGGASDFAPAMAGLSLEIFFWVAMRWTADCMLVLGYAKVLPCTGKLALLKQLMGHIIDQRPSNGESEFWQPELMTDKTLSFHVALCTQTAKKLHVSKIKERKRAGLSEQWIWRWSVNSRRSVTGELGQSVTVGERMAWHHCKIVLHVWTF